MPTLVAGWLECQKTYFGWMQDSSQHFLAVRSVEN